MRWSIPLTGDERERRIFALVPRQYGREMLWLEHVVVTEELVWTGVDTVWIETLVRPA